MITTLMWSNYNWQSYENYIRVRKQIQNALVTRDKSESKSLVPVMYFLMVIEAKTENSQEYINCQLIVCYTCKMQKNKGRDIIFSLLKYFFHKFFFIAALFTRQWRQAHLNMPLSMANFHILKTTENDYFLVSNWLN